MSTRRKFLKNLGIGLSGVITELSLLSAKADQKRHVTMVSTTSKDNGTGKEHDQHFSQTISSDIKGASKMKATQRGEGAYRPPYLTKFTTTEEPLLVLSTLLSRADKSPLSKRRRDSHLLLDSKGELVVDPDLTSSNLAFEDDPNVGFEKWCKYWRQVHGPRFVHALKPKSIQQLLRYDQIHRTPSGPTSLDQLPYSAPVDKNLKLFDTVVGHIPPYLRPQWDGIAYLTFENLDSLKEVLGSEEVQTKIIPEDQAIFRELAPVITNQHIILPSQTQRDPIQLVKTHVRNKEINRSQFQDKWLHSHSELVLSKPATHKYVKRYAQLHNVGPIKKDEPLWHHMASQIDGVTLMSFSCMNDVEDYLMSDDYLEVEADEYTISNRQESEYWTALSHNIVNQIYPERATSR